MSDLDRFFTFRWVGAQLSMGFTLLAGIFYLLCLPLTPSVRVSVVGAGSAAPAAKSRVSFDFWKVRAKCFSAMGLP